MSQSILRNEDFKSSSNPEQIQGFFYRGEGFPNGRITSPTLGALYLDSLSGQLWCCNTVNSTLSTSWTPISANYITSAAFATDVQNGDLVGIFGTGAWSSSSATLSAARWDNGGGGAQNAAFSAGGEQGAGTPTGISQIFNGLVWSAAGNLSVSTNAPGKMGSMNAGLIAGGATGGGALKLSRKFNGSTWTDDSNTLSIKKEYCAGAGTMLAALVAGGFTSTVTELTNDTETHNGSIWTLISAKLIQARCDMPAIGSQNATFVIGGLVANQISNTEIFNGTSWSSGPLYPAVREATMCGGNLMSCFTAGGITKNGAGGYTTTSFLFNGSSWVQSNSLPAVRSAGASGGTPLRGFAAGGHNGSAMNSTVLLNQNTYKRLDYTNLPSAANIGICLNTSSTSLTGTVLAGQIASTIIPQNHFFGISRFNTSGTYVRLSSVTGTISSVTVTTTGLATINLSTTLTSSFWNGMGVLVSGGLTQNVYPVVGGTDISPIVRWNTSSSASTSLTFSSVSLLRFNNLTATSITVSSGVANINLTNFGNLSATTFVRWAHVGNVIYIPASTTSGSAGSAYNYGAYRINSLTVSGGVATVSVTINNSLAITESMNTAGIIIYQQPTVSRVGLSEADAQLGFNNKMHSPNRPFWDDTSAGLI